MAAGFWPAELVEQLAARRGVLFLGAGASRSCASSVRGRQFPNWYELLDVLAAELSGADAEACTDLMKRGRLLDAAQVIFDCVSEARLRTILISRLDAATFTPSEIYTAVNLIDQQVVMTTNYDRMYEKFWDSLTPDQAGLESRPLMVSSPDSRDVVADLRSSRRLLMKLHGTIDRPDTLILSRSQYSDARLNKAQYFSVVSALMLTHTMLFIGCGFTGDPDIDLILEDAAFASSSAAPHYALLPAGRHESELRALKSSFGIQALEYDPADDHRELGVRLNELAELVQGSRI